MQEKQEKQEKEKEKEKEKDKEKRRMREEMAALQKTLVEMRDDVSKMRASHGEVFEEEKQRNFLTRAEKETIQVISTVVVKRNRKQLADRCDGDAGKVSMNIFFFQ